VGHDHAQIERAFLREVRGRPQGDFMSELLAVSNTELADRVADVIFIHGLDGNAQTTWQIAGRQDTFWPAWLGEDLPNIGVWSLGYEVSSLAWRGTTMPLSDRALNALTLLDTYDIGKRPLVFIVHSMGGLLVKQMLRHARDLNDPAWTAVMNAARGIVFLSTPHSGSDIASWVEHVGTLLRASVSIKELKAHDPRLRELNIWYRNNVGTLGIKTQVYYEKYSTRGVLVVNATSADPGISGVTPVPMDADHSTITKPEDRNTLIYRSVKRFVESCLAEPPRREPESATNPR